MDDGFKDRFKQRKTHFGRAVLLRFISEVKNVDFKSVALVEDDSWFRLLLRCYVPKTSVMFCWFLVWSDKLEVRYRLDGSKSAETLHSKVRNLANGHLHTVTISRLADAVSLQVTDQTHERLHCSAQSELEPESDVVSRCFVIQLHRPGEERTARGELQSNLCQVIFLIRSR